MSNKNTAKRLKSISKIVKPKDICLLALTHQRNHSCVLSKFIGTPADIRTKTCFSCDWKLRNKHDKEVKSGTFTHTYECYRDLRILDSLRCVRSFIRCEHSTEEMIEELNRRVEDFRLDVGKKWDQVVV